MRAIVICALAMLIAPSCVESNPQPFPGKVTMDASMDFGISTGDDIGYRVTPDVPPYDMSTQFDATDLSSSDLTSPEIAPQCPTGTGCFLDPCVDNGDCQSGWCVQHLGAGICTQHCQEECPAGWSCQQVAGTDPDVVYLCVSQYANLCRPCASSADCVSAGGAQDACVVYPGQGSFCGGPCGEDDVCPVGFSCMLAQSSERSELQQCVADAGVCECSQTSVSLGLTTPCAVANSDGVCHGYRTCTEEGLSECDAASAKAETCTGIEDDCDGELDEPTLADGVYTELCDDGNDCTKDLCVGAEGCQQEALEGTECKDDDPCTVGDHCEAGACVSTPAICNDDNPCTDDSCEASGKCLFSPNNDDCDDLNPCTVADQCAEGSCNGTSVNCDCAANSDCGILEDGDLCNGTLFCNTEKLPYTCEVAPESIVSCPMPQGPDAVCLQAVCAPESGECSQVPAFVGFACDDGDECTVGDLCVEGLCSGGVATNCADDNPCTDDSCEPETGCQHIDNVAPCNDGNVCTTSDSCVDGICQGGPPLVCDDANICNGGESCDPDVGCLASEPLKCDDGNDCNGVESCHPELGCQEGPAPDCNDGNPCTDDSCGVDGQCVNNANNGWCDDGNACTDGDHCQGGSCKPTASVDCDDDNLCTTDKCDLLEGCVYTTNALPCTDDNVCTNGDQCSGGSCEPGQPLICNDGNGCTDDGCDTDSGCTFLPNSLACSDGNVCTVEDQCSDGNCAGGEPLVCNDQDPCTDDSCDPAQGCQTIHNQADCDDKNVCTNGDQCEQGACLSGPQIDCDDENQCTQDSCDAQKGCQYPPMPDNTPCAANDICVGSCVNGACGETAVEACDGADNTCDGEVDEGFPDTDTDGEADCVDSDDDGDGSLDDDDCQPLNKNVSPLQQEVCFNGVDDDCNIATGDECKLLHCQDYLDAGLANGDGVYLIDPDGEGPGSSFNVYCDMTTDGGGWTLCLNSLTGSKSPSTDIVSNSGVADWNSGHVRDCSLLGADTTAQIRHLIIDNDRDRVVNGYYSGTYHSTLPAENSWMAVDGVAARPGEEHTTFGGSCGFDYHFGRSWGCDGGCCQTYTYQWYYGGCWNYIPVQSGGYCADGPSDGCGGGNGSCIERYSIFVRPN